MPAIINRNVITQVNQDNGSLTAATTIAHKFSESGEYHGLVLSRGGNASTVGKFTIVVKGAEKTEDRGDHQKRMTKASIDLSALHAQASSTDDNGNSKFEIETDGYAVFNVPTGASGGYAVEVYKAGGEGLGPKVFDSRKLDESDVLAMILIRPGVYSVTNSTNGAKAELTVSYPEGKRGQPEPVKVRCTTDAINPDKIKVRPIQGLLFSFETPSRLKVELVKPDDRPRPPRNPISSQSGEKADHKGGSASARKKTRAPRTFAVVPSRKFS